MEDKNLMWLPDVLAIACILVSAMTIFMTVLVQLRRKTVRMTKLPSLYFEDDQLHRRPLGKMETVFHNLHKDGNLQVSMAALAKTSAPLDENIILRVTQHLMQRHPMLRMRLVEIDGHPHFLPGVKEIPLKTVTSQNWLETFEDSLTEKLDETKHLWNLLLVEQTGQSNKSLLGEVAFIFTFHHAIGDGLCKTRLVTEFIAKLNKVFTDRKLEQNRYSLRPPLDNYMQSLVDRSSSEKFLFGTLDKLPSNSPLIKVAQKKYLSTPKPKQNEFINKLGAVCNDNPSVHARTCVIPMQFTKAETESVLKACRERDATVQGMLTAAASITMRDVLDGATVAKSEMSSVQIRTTINMRRYLDGKVPEEYMGSYFVGLFGQDVVIPECNSLAEKFWVCARNSTQNLKSQLQEKRFVTKFWNLLETVHHLSKMPKQKTESPNVPSGPNRTNEVLSLNNYGSCPSKGNATDIVQLKSCFCAVTEHVRGPIFTINAVTVEGQLCLSFVYYTNITTQETAVNFANNLKYKILNYSKSK